jgi:glycosyltransferase involved in cell wall biosynthesis
LRSGLEWLFREVNPILKKMGQPIRWKILGRIQPDVSLRQLTGESEYLDWVQDIDAELRQADAVVLPDTSGTGLKNRTLHAMACGIPVIGSTHAFEGFPVRKGVQAHVHDDAAGFADALMKVLHHPDHASGMSMAGRQFAVNGYGIESIASRWCDLYTSITTPRTTASVIMRA